MQTMVQEVALGNRRKYRVIWLGRLTKTTRLRQDNLFRDREFQQEPINTKHDEQLLDWGFRCVLLAEVCGSSVSQQAPLCTRKGRWVFFTPSHPHTGQTEVS